MLPLEADKIKHMKRLHLLIFVVSPFFLASQSILPEELLDKSIQYHDPDGKWTAGIYTFKLTETRPKGADRSTEIIIDLPGSRFEIDQLRDKDQIFRKVQQDHCTHSINGSTDLKKEQIEKHRLDCERTKLLRDYYVYLWGLPMKLKDPGTILGKEVIEDTFEDIPCYSIRVTYSPEVGEDIWYFYFDKTTYALIGYRFYHEEDKNDGEFITCEGETQVGSLRLPKTRKWYVNKDRRFLGADILEGGSFSN